MLMAFSWLCLGISSGGAQEMMWDSWVEIPTPPAHMLSWPPKSLDIPPPSPAKLFHGGTLQGFNQAFSSLLSAVILFLIKNIKQMLGSQMVLFITGYHWLLPDYMDLFLDFSQKTLSPM